MTWARLDDRWTQSVFLEALPHEFRWHYLAMIEFLCRTDRYDGVMRTTDARRCSDVEDPAAALGALVAAGLVTSNADGTYTVVKINDHIVPPHMRDDARKQAQRERSQRSRAHKAGDHSRCDGKPCRQAGAVVAPQSAERTSQSAVTVTRDVTRDPGSGRAGSAGRRPQTQRREEREVVEGWPTLELCRVCDSPLAKGRAQAGVHENCVPASAA